MSGVPITVRIENLIRIVLEEKGIELLEVEFSKEDDVQTLRVFIDRDEGVDLETCTIATRAIQDIIDQDNIEYDQMEVSSPGPNRILKTDKDFKKFQGSRVKARTLKAMDGQKNFIGLLVDADESNISIEIEGLTKQIPREMISVVRLDSDI